MNKWWNQTVFYQIYMPSFCDGNDDGIGDFKGIQSKLPYLKELGIGGIWLTPFYPSPKVDNGYDISDYYGIDSDYGTMEDFECFIKAAHKLGIRVISDLVVNHSSTRHPWFMEARANKNSPKRDWYIWQSGVPGQLPNNWESFFGESAWEYDAVAKEYYYHSFAVEQADLNWKNKELKKEILKLLRFWKEKGIDGFRLDVINNLTLQDVFPDNPIGEDGKQIHKYDVNQPGIDDIFAELRAHLSPDDDFFLVGEISSEDLSTIHSYTGEGKLHTTFNFNLGSMPVFQFSDFYQQVERMNELYQDGDYPTLFFGSHDMGRFASRFQFSQQKIKAMITFLLTGRGIPFLYFGDEIGMKSLVHSSVEEAKDIQGIIAYHKAIRQGKGAERALEDLNAASRDKSRNTMRWNGGVYGGFSSCHPWITQGEVEVDCNVEAQMQDQNSVWFYVKELIQLRKDCKELQIGSSKTSNPSPDVFVMKREIKESCSYIVINFSKNVFEYMVEDNAKLLIASGEIDYYMDGRVQVPAGVSAVFHSANDSYNDCKC